MTTSTTSQVQLSDPLLGHPLAGGRRASDADRERAVDVLSDAFAEGRLSTEELSARVDQVYGARTYAELATVSADLPSVPAASPPVPRSGGATAQGARAAERRTSPLAVAALVCSMIPGLPQLAAIILGIEALRRIRRTGERGAVFATAGLALAALGLIFAAFLVF